MARKCVSAISSKQGYVFMCFFRQEIVVSTSEIDKLAESAPAVLCVSVAIGILMYTP